jgi:hypothetical protein
MFLSQFDMTIEHRSGHSNKAADFFSRYPVENEDDELSADPEEWLNMSCAIEDDEDYL